MLLMSPQQAITPETITTYADDCVTPKSNFNFGDTVCAKIDGGIPLSIASRRFAWVDTSNRVLTRTDVTSVPQTDLFVIPARDLANDNRGLWRVNSISSRSSVRASAFFNVSDPNDAAANVLVYDLINTDTADVASGSNIEFAMWISNKGPNAATNVALANSVGGGATFVQSVQDSGPPFTCTQNGAGTNCTIVSLPAGTSARIRVIYNVVGGATPGTIIANTATISSDTPDQEAANNTSLAELVVTDNSPPGGSCAISCPANITKAADSVVSGQSGAVVTFADAVTSGDCGSITATPASGSFFAVGTTTVTLASSAGESCSFNVTVTEGNTAPTISCPTAVNQDAGGDCSTEVTAAELGAPTATGTGVTVEGERSDHQALDAPYSVGTTTITWTATDENNQVASCSQTVTITGTDLTAPTLTVPPDVTDYTGAVGAACGKIVGETELGTATAEDNCSTATVTRSGVPAGNFFPTGQTLVTYKAKDGSGNTVTATQKVTIIDNTPPRIAAPDDENYTCPSEVPAVNPALATQGDVLDANGNLLPPAPPSDNCSIPVVTVTETSSGVGSAASPRIILRTYKATDASGNTASDTQTITVIDSTPPTIATPANITVYLPLNSTATSMPVTYSTTASDNCAPPPPTITFSPASGSTFNVGTTTVTATATDAVGNTASTTFTVTVLYNFAGFFSPVGNLPTLNTVNAGKAIPVKFSLSGNKGLNIFAPNSPYSVSINCSTTDPAADIVETLNAGGSSLSYSTDQYNYVWKTESSWAGTCRQLVVTLNDGSVHRANFKFK
jgi:hypothetical protein